MADNIPLLTFGYGVLFGYGSDLIQRHASVDQSCARGPTRPETALGSVRFRWAPSCFRLSSAWLSTLWGHGATGVIPALSGCTAALLQNNPRSNFVDVVNCRYGPVGAFFAVVAGAASFSPGGMMTIGYVAGILSNGGDVMLAMTGAVFVNIGNAGTVLRRMGLRLFSPGRVAMTRISPH